MTILSFASTGRRGIQPQHQSQHFLTAMTFDGRLPSSTCHLSSFIYWHVPLTRIHGGGTHGGCPRRHSHSHGENGLGGKRSGSQAGGWTFSRGVQVRSQWDFAFQPSRDFSERNIINLQFGPPPGALKARHHIYNNILTTRLSIETSVLYWVIVCRHGGKVSTTCNIAT